MPAESTPPPESLDWAARVWKRLSVFECAGLLYIALRYNHRQVERTTADYVESMAMLPWLGLGPPLQHDITRALLSLRLKMSDGANLLS